MQCAARCKLARLSIYTFSVRPARRSQWVRFAPSPSFARLPGSVAPPLRGARRPAPSSAVRLTGGAVPLPASAEPPLRGRDKLFSLLAAGGAVRLASLAVRLPVVGAPLDTIEITVINSREKTAKNRTTVRLAGFCRIDKRPLMCYNDTVVPTQI